MFHLEFRAEVNPEETSHGAIVQWSDCSSSRLDGISHCVLQSTWEIIYLTHLLRSRPWPNVAYVCVVSAGRNQLLQIFWPSVKVFRFNRGWNFDILHWLRQSPLIQGCANIYNVSVQVWRLFCRLVSRSTGNVEHRLDNAADITVTDCHIHVRPHRQQEFYYYCTCLFLPPLG